ncbi:MAG TPA: tetratricopeptide repeat protein [Pirellulales bacterium]|nr:tetratricopeptide repeat protein [Pirellulales bacterium]
MPKSRLSVWIQVTSVACLAAGCATPSLKQGFDKGQPTIGSRSGPIKQIAASIGTTKVGQSISGVFKPKTGVPPPDATWLNSKTKPATPEFYVNLGKVAENSNDIEGAREAYHKALKMKPHHLGALVGLGRVFERQGQLDRAAQHYLEATQFHKNDASVFNDLGMCHLRQRRYDDALVALTRAVELQPDRELYRNNIAAVLVKLNRIDEALAQLTDAHGAAVAHYDVGCLLHAEHRDPLALEHFQLAMQLQPSFPEARQWIEALSAARPADDRVAVRTAGASDHDVAVDAEQGPTAMGLAVPEREPLPSPNVSRPPTDVADAGDGETVAMSDDGNDVSADEASPVAAKAEVRVNEGVSEARLQPLPPVDRKYRAPSRY